MKSNLLKIKTHKLIYLSFVTLFLAACGPITLEEDFEEVNKDVPKKVLKQLRYDNANPYKDDYTIQFGYDGDGKLISVTDGEETSFFNYDSNGNLESISGSNDSFDVSKLYESPYDAFKVGTVLEYDDNGNPSKIDIIDEQWDGKDENFIGEISYDDKPNPFFYTFQAGGIIDVLDRVKLYFNSSSSTVVKAYELLPFNNISGMIIRNMANNQIVAEIQYDTTYDKDGYVINSTIHILTEDENETYYISYTYK